MTTLHVTNGSSTAALIEAAGLPGRVISWADSLYDGPVPAVPDDELIRIRAAYHAANPNRIDEVAADLAGWRAAVDDHEAYNELVLWYEHDLFDQLNLIHLLTWIGRHNALHTPVTLISIDSVPGRDNFMGLGQLTPAEIASLYGARTHIGEAHVTTARKAWQAFRSDDPRAIEAILAADTTALPFLAAALRRHLEEFPEERSGLSRSERRLLELAGAGLTKESAWRRMHEGERAYYITDMSYEDRIRELTASSPPLLSESFALTEEGRGVLEGRNDRVRLCGIDRWLGGVHLQGRGPVWRWSNALRSLRLG